LKPNAPSASSADVADGTVSDALGTRVISRQANAVPSAPRPIVPNQEPAAPDTDANTFGASRDAEPSIPDHLLLRCFARGAYGEVWLAKSAIGTYAAVKVVYRSAFPTHAPYDREFNGLQKFAPISRSHPGLVNILHVGRNEIESYFYSIMELADDEERGETVFPESYKPKTLANLLRSRRKLPVNECIEIGLQLSSALEFLHGRNLIHRDIKPSNIIFVNRVAKFADVGLVTEITRTQGKVTYLGTEGYIAPEGPGTAAADLFGLGKVLYEASTGKDRLEFPDLPSSLFETSDELAVQFNALMVKACAFKPEDRIETASELHQKLRELTQKQ
jgi:serine/threonine protein kinase